MVAYNFKKRFVDPIRAGLGIYEPILGLQPKIVRPKRQTIRTNGKRRHARAGETLQLYYGQRTLQCESIGVARCVSAEPIAMMIRNVQWSMEIEIDGRRLSFPKDRLDFAQADGFEDGADMWQFWIDEHGPGVFEGTLIKWEPIR